MSKFSIVIPTRNRQNTAISSIRTAIECIGQNKEVIVVDNSDNLVLRQMLLEEGIYDQVVYIKTDTVLSMQDNWELGLNYSTGDYVSFMGDDDGITAYALCAMEEFITKADPDVVHCRLSTYNWPNSLFPGISNMLYVPQNFAKGTLISNPRKLLEDVFSFKWNMGTGYSIYRGFVKRSLILKIKEHHGEYFFHESPDLAAGYSSLLYAEKILSVQYPLFVSGHSPESNSGSMRSYAKYFKSIQGFKAESKDGAGSLWDYPRCNASYLVNAHLNFLPVVEKIIKSKLDVSYVNAFNLIARDVYTGHEDVHRYEIRKSLLKLAERWKISDNVDIPSTFKLTSGKQLQIGISRGSDDLYGKFAYDLSHLDIRDIAGAVTFLKTFLPLPVCAKSNNPKILSFGITSWASNIIEKAELHFSNGDVDRAISCYREYLGLMNYDANVYETLGDVFVGAGRLDEGIFCFARSFSLAARPNTFEKYVLALIKNCQADIAKVLLEVKIDTGDPIISLQSREMLLEKIDEFYKYESRY